MIFLIGRSETTERFYYLISKGYDNIYFNSNVFANLLKKGLIEQGDGNFSSWDYQLSKLGREISL